LDIIITTEQQINREIIKVRSYIILLRSGYSLKSRL